MTGLAVLWLTFCVSYFAQQQTRADIEMNEWAAGDNSYLMDREQSVLVEKVEVYTVETAVSSDDTGANTKGNTPLHSVVLSVCRKRHKYEGSYTRIHELMNSHEVKLNVPNKRGYSAIGCAVHHLHKTCIEHMLKDPSASRLHLDYYPGDRESTVREIIVETYPELQPLLPEPLTESLDSSDRHMKLLAALQHDNYDIFLENLELNNPNPWYDEPYHSTLLEIACQMQNREQFVTLLLDSGADPNTTNSVTGMPLIHATVRSGNFELLSILCKNEAVSLTDNEGRTVLHWLAGVSERKPDDKDKIENCLKSLLSTKNVNTCDSAGNTALCIAVERGFQDRAKLLLSEGADIAALEHGSKLLLSASLSILEEILDDCLKSNEKPLTSKDLQIRLNYQLLMNIVPRMADSHHLRGLLRHPVMSTFFILKWQKIRFFFFIGLAYYVSFVLFLTAFILCSEYYSTQIYGVVDGNTTDSFGFNDSHRLITSGMSDSHFASQQNDSSLLFLWYSLTALWFSLILKELQQLILYRWAYIRSLENWLEILLIVATFISCSGAVGSVEIKHHFSAVAILLAWLELVVMSGRLPLLSVQMEMLKTVSLTFLKFMAGYVLLLVAFALCFCVLFKGGLEKDGNNMFGNPFLSLLRTTVMFTGEFEVSTLSFDTLPVTSHVIFISYVVLVAIVLLNLLNGLAVSDTEAIRQDAETLSLVARVKLISRIEEVLSALPKCMKPSVELTKHMFKIYPNRPNKIGSTAVRSLLSIINKEMQTDKKRKSTDSQENWSMFTEKLSALQLRQEKMETNFDSKFAETQRILTEILTRLNARECETTRVEF